MLLVQVLKLFVFIKNSNKIAITLITLSIQSKYIFLNACNIYLVIRIN